MQERADPELAFSRSDEQRWNCGRAKIRNLRTEIVVGGDDASGFGRTCERFRIEGKAGVDLADI
jgi:hypothetical protein